MWLDAEQEHVLKRALEILREPKPQTTRLSSTGFFIHVIKMPKRLLKKRFPFQWSSTAVI